MPKPRIPRVERLRRDDLDVALITTSHDHHDLQRLCATIRADPELFDLPVVLVGARPSLRRPRPAVCLGRLGRPVPAVPPRGPAPARPGLGAPAASAPPPAQRPRATSPPTTDRLTRLYGHGFLHAYVGHLIEQSARSGGPLGLVGLDVDQMGQINRLYGYAAGDRVLAAIGGVLARTSRAEDLPARLDGDRFCLVMNHATALDARAAAERIGTLLSHTPIALDERPPHPGDAQDRRSPSSPRATMRRR